MNEPVRPAAGVDKKQLRQSLLEARDAINPQMREQYSAAACGHLSQWLIEQGASQVMGYASFRSELDLAPFVEWAWQSGVDVIMPKCEVTDRSMTLHRIKSWDELVSGSYGIMEPDPKVSTALPADQWPNIIIVPGAAFDLSGGRLGYGGGYYDRFAERVEQMEVASRAIWIGAAFESQIAGEELPMQSHDKRMDGLLTENGLLFF
ncbi:5-formyltetrahydrofolate cyclo-ligase [Paenibacillus sp. NEAU-GSW1]|uniref:5-formyltetrahydrofolate cyclo-ligase n=1 Tax=Paenibacillus sp. NEAU-GSW1 TaxID=2682486 RepID=UPI0012E2FC50|nr:5-formyltetrahydrofolate cyclo-ligase [Paenibacillus sp. NEAU-GSW1]MUT67868.1 5-formyltetrahydrofolate cyclo-ligase [Paenibacillus sp. NEAU-GSW1]